MTVLCADEERSGPVHHLDLQVGAVFQQLLHDFQVVTLTGYEQRGPAILKDKFKYIPELIIQIFLMTRTEVLV